jgi:rhodanese-related sulfurtransferase
MDSGEDLYVVDLRTAPDNDSPSVPGAVRFSLEDVASNMQQIPRDREIILYCS